MAKEVRYIEIIDLNVSVDENPVETLIFMSDEPIDDLEKSLREILFVYDDPDNPHKLETLIKEFCTIHNIELLTMESGSVEIGL